MPDPASSILPWLAAAARAEREAKGRLHSHVAASASMDQSAISRFERAGAWPRDPDRIVGAYADDLDLPPSAIWAAALDLWQAQSAEKRLGEALEQEAQRSRARREAPAEGTDSSDARGGQQ